MLLVDGKKMLCCLMFQLPTPHGMQIGSWENTVIFLIIFFCCSLASIALVLMQVTTLSECKGELNLMSNLTKKFQFAFKKFCKFELWCYVTDLIVCIIEVFVFAVSYSYLCICQTHLTKTTCVQDAEVSLTECLKTAGTVCQHLYEVRVSTLF